MTTRPAHLSALGLAAIGALHLLRAMGSSLPGSISPAFRRRDRSAYAPLCLALAALALPSVVDRPAR
jgi:hypothetical protein